MAFEIVRNDIVKMDVDAIVNTANPRPVIGDGTDRAVHEAAGPELLEARRKIGDIPRGGSAITPGFNLKARYVIHTVGVYWKDGKHGEEETLRRCYESALELALENRCRSIAFPLLSAGNYGFPKDRALSVAVRTCNDFLLRHRMKIYLVVFNPEAFRLSERLVDAVRSFVDEHYVNEAGRREYRHEYLGAPMQKGMSRRRSEEDLCFASQLVQEGGAYQPRSSAAELKKHLAEELLRKGESFTECMCRIIKEKDWTDPEVYSRIYMDRKTFNKIKNDPDHQPKKKTAVQLASALQLSYDQAKDFIGKAGYAFTDTSVTDLIFVYCFKHVIYDPDTIDALLYEIGEKTSFSAE